MVSRIVFSLLNEGVTTEIFKAFIDWLRRAMTGLQTNLLFQEGNNNSRKKIPHNGVKTIPIFPLVLNLELLQIMPK